MNRSFETPAKYVVSLDATLFRCAANDMAFLPYVREGWNDGRLMARNTMINGGDAGDNTLKIFFPIG
jgi:hypothetical protein